MADVSWADGLSAVSALAGLGTALIALRIGRNANEAAHQSNRAADRANATAETVAQVERERWHHELTPRFNVTVTRLGPGTGQASLMLTFEGPPALERLDAVEVSVRDDGYTHAGGLAGGPSAQEIADTVWGPYRFRPGIDGVSRNGRDVPAASMELGDWRKLVLERTPSPSWTDPEYWRERYDRDPVRLWVRCRRERHQPWLLTYSVPVSDPQ
jgi:hypothetical protein